MYFEDNDTQQVLISTHVLFDEAHRSILNSHAPIGSQVLQRTGYSPEDDNDVTKPSQSNSNCCPKMQQNQPLQQHSLYASNYTVLTSTPSLYNLIK